jgi:hypothetical protein
VTRLFGQASGRWLASYSWIDPRQPQALHAAKIGAECGVVQPVAGRCLDTNEAGRSQQCALDCLEGGRCAAGSPRISPDRDAADRLGRIDGWDHGRFEGWPALDSD